MPEILQSACAVFALDASFLYDAGTSARQPFLEQEFDDTSEYRHFAMQTRDRATQFLRAAAPQFPLEAAQAVDALVQQCATLIVAAAPTSSMKSQAVLHAQAILVNVEALALPLQTVVESSLDDELRRAVTPALARSLMVLIRHGCKFHVLLFQNALIWLVFCICYLQGYFLGRASVCQLAISFCWQFPHSACNGRGMCH